MKAEDRFAEENLPPKDQWPVMRFDLAPGLEYPESLNCAVELLDSQLDKYGDKIFFHADEPWSYREFAEKSNQIAGVLKDKFRMPTGARVLLRGPNTPMLAATWFGVLKAGGICVATMPLLRAAELEYTVEKAEIDYCLCDGRWKDELIETQKRAPRLSNVLYFYDESSEDSLERVMQEYSTEFEAVQTDADDVALIAFTSGTTGEAKATMHFHRDVMAICDCFPSHVLKSEESDVFIGTPPFAFTFGLGALLLFPLRCGGSVVLVEKPSPEIVLELIQKYKVTTCFTSPTAYRSVLAQIDSYDTGSLKKCVSAGEPLPEATFEQWREKTGIKIIDGIGSTEILHIFISASEDQIKPGATGKPIPGYEAIVTDEAGKELPAGEVGLLAVRGPTGCRYLNDERQKQYVRNGWNYTGDAYMVDQDGYFWFQCRADDMIISSGYNISGIEVEGALLKHTAVQECGVVAAPDQARGNIVKAFVVLKEGVDPNENLIKELQNHVKQEIAPYKYPRAIEFLTELPKTGTGKLQRFKLREAVAT